MAIGSETLIIVGIGLYPLPTLIAAAREKTHGAAGVFLLNIFLGWTLIGWLVAFIWACSGRTAAEDHRDDNPIMVGTLSSLTDKGARLGSQLHHAQLQLEQIRQGLSP